MRTLALVVGSGLAIGSASAAPVRAQAETDPGPCDELVAYLREALAGPVPELDGDRGIDEYRAHERKLEGKLRSTGCTQPQAYTTVPVLAVAHERHAIGHDRLRDAVCTDDGTMSDDRVHACATPAAEDEWPQSDRAWRWLTKGAATAVFAGAVTAAFVERTDEVSRTIATGAAVPMGAVLGAGIAMALHQLREPRPAIIAIVPIGGAIAGAVLGGLAAHALAASPGARAPVTAVALAPFYSAIVLASSVD
ncbi:MAG TPA: hypothetical protein VFH68_13910 [Polyangia bacterium]|nr:hypothetical protein [Polyangia bacterium]